jgi:hypothetical protein
MFGFIVPPVAADSLAEELVCGTICGTDSGEGFEIACVVESR